MPTHEYIEAKGLARAEAVVATAKIAEAEAHAQAASNLIAAAASEIAAARQAASIASPPDSDLAARVGEIARALDLVTGATGSLADNLSALSTLLADAKSRAIDPIMWLPQPPRPGAHVEDEPPPRYNASEQDLV